MGPIILYVLLFYLVPSCPSSIYIYNPIIQCRKPRVAISSWKDTLIAKELGQLRDISIKC